MQHPVDFDSFLSTYVNTNISPGSIRYDRHFLLDQLLGDLIAVNKERLDKIAFHILVAMCCAMKRADLLPPLFQAFVQEEQTSSNLKPQTAATELFYGVRETINIIWPFVGVPQVIPACLGLAGYLQIQLGETSTTKNRLRQDVGPDDVNLGVETRRSIYKASANSEVFEMLDNYFGDFAYALNGIGFGYNIGRVPAEIFSLAQSEMILTAALVALGATRQAGSHIKACIAFGFSQADVEAVIHAAERLAQWLGIVLPSATSPINVRELARQARSRLEVQ